MATTTAPSHARPTDEVYAPPTADVDAPPTDAPASEKPGRLQGKRSLGLMVAAVLLIAAAFAVVLASVGLLAVMLYAMAIVIAFFGLVIGIRALRLLSREADSKNNLLAVGVFFGVLLNGIMSIGGTFLALVATFGFSRGRQLRRFGRVLLPPVRSSREWNTQPIQVDVEPGVCAALAAQWRENGRTEHASVAAFARLTLDLMALGAPPELVAAANRDALDEIRHTELCFSLAAALDGKAESPGPFPAAQTARTLPTNRTLALATLAVDSLVDGALHEGISARVIAKLARRCQHPGIVAILKEIAADEGRHAAHGWDVVEWCLAEGGRPIAEALHGAALALPKAGRSDLPISAQDGAWEQYGIHGRDLEAEQFAETRTDLLRRVERLVAQYQVNLRQKSAKPA